MRTDTYAHPGETLTCAGCHEDKHASPKVHAPPLALRRAPSELRPEVPEAYPLTFARLVQPVLNERCIGCHDREAKAPSLHGDRFGKFGWSEAFHTLSQHAWGMSGGNGIALTQRQYSVPGQEGARISKLYSLLSRGHHHLKLTAPEWRRLTLWLDCNSNFYAAYTDLEKQARGELIRPLWGVPKWSQFEELVRSHP